MGALSMGGAVQRSFLAALCMGPPSWRSYPAAPSSTLGTRGPALAGALWLTVCLSVDCGRDAGWTVTSRAWQQSLLAVTWAVTDGSVLTFVRILPSEHGDT